MDKPYSEAAAMIKEARLRKGIAVEDLIEVLDVSQSHWSRWETGEHQPRKETLQKICDMLDLDFNEVKRAYKRSRYRSMVEQDREIATGTNEDELAEALTSTASALKSLDLRADVKIGLLESLRDRIETEIKKLRGE